MKRFRKILCAVLAVLALCSGVVFADAIDLPVIPFNPGETLFGNLNGDKKTDAKDLVLLMTYISGSTTPPSKADLNNDKAVDLLDLVCLMKYIADNAD